MSLIHYSPANSLRVEHLSRASTISNILKQTRREKKSLGHVVLFRGFLSPYHPLLSMFGIPLFSVGEDIFIPILFAKGQERIQIFFKQNNFNCFVPLYGFTKQKISMVYYIAESAAKVIFHCSVLPYLALLDWTDTEG